MNITSFIVVAVRPTSEMIETFLEPEAAERRKNGFKISMFGLDGAGKTAILYMLKLGEVVSCIPTIGFNVESIDVEDTSFTIFDVGGQDKIRTLWRHYYEVI